METKVAPNTIVEDLLPQKFGKLGVTWTVNSGKAILFPLKRLSIFQLAIDLDAGLSLSADVE